MKPSASKARCLDLSGSRCLVSPQTDPLPPFGDRRYMLLKEAGGEFAFIKRIINRDSDHQIIVPNGDDAAVIEIGGELVAVSTDTIVEGDHFSFDYFSPYQVGMKAIESSVSDIVAIGGKPTYVFLSLCLSKNTHIEPMEEIYRGIGDACQRCGCVVLGGDTTHSDKMVISVTVMGAISSRDRICTRSGAKPGDLIFVSGPLGGSLGGLALLRKTKPGFDEIKKFHLEPRCRIDLADTLPEIANAMIDVSDGLSSEVHHICSQSKVGAVIREDAVPLPTGLKEVAKMLGKDPYTYAYSGGEDFQLVYTVAPKNRSRAIGHEIGEITESLDILIERGGKLLPFENRGYDHFLLE